MDETDDAQVWVGPAGRLEIPMELMTPRDSEADRQFHVELVAHLADPLQSDAARVATWTRWFPDGDAISHMDDPAP